MTPHTLAQLASNLNIAADLVDAINNHDLQRRRGWNLQQWTFDLVPWGVRFVHRDEQQERREVVVQLPIPKGSGRRHGPLAEVLM